MQVSREPGSSARLCLASGFSGTGKLAPVPGHVPKLFNLIGKSLGSFRLPEAGKGKFPSAHPVFLFARDRLLHRLAPGAESPTVSSQHRGDVWLG